MERRRTPQEKKQLSYERDGRNAVAEKRATAHRAITRRKAKANRALRHAQSRAVRDAAHADADVFVGRTGRRSWRKIPDVPLALYVEARLGRREASGMNEAAEESEFLRRARERVPPRPLRLKGSLQPVGDSAG